jgi:hypothetical protein
VLEKVKKGGKTGLGVLPRKHRHPKSGGAATPRVLPTWPRLRSVVKRVALSCLVCTTMPRAVHRPHLSGATVVGTTPFF